LDSWREKGRLKEASELRSKEKIGQEKDAVLNGKGGEGKKK